MILIKIDIILNDTHMTLKIKTYLMTLSYNTY